MTIWNVMVGKIIKKEWRKTIQMELSKNREFDAGVCEMWVT